MIWLTALAWALAAYMQAAMGPASEGRSIWLTIPFSILVLAGLFWLAVYAVCRVAVAIGREIRGEDRKPAEPSVPEQEAARPAPSGPGWWRE